MLPNDVKLKMNMINKMDTYLVMENNRAIYVVANSIKKIHIQKDMHLIYKQDFYKNKKKEIYELFIEYLVPIMDDLDHPSFI